MAADRPTTLTDVLAAITSSVAHGRQAADAEVTRVARLYQRNEYLQGMSVPRLRLQQVAIDLPLVCLKLVQGQPCKVSEPEFIAKTVLQLAAAIEEGLAPLQASIELQQTLGSVEAGGLTPKAYEILTAVFATQSEHATLDLSEQLAERYRLALNGLVDAQRETDLPDSAIRERVGDLTENLVRGKVIELVRAAMDGPAADGKNQPADPGRAPEMDTETSRMVQMILGSNTIRELVFMLRQTAEDAAIEKPMVSPNLEVEVNTEEVKNSASSGAVTRLSLTLTEEGLEWASETGATGSKSWRLLPE